MRRAVEIIRLIRVVNCLLAAVGIWIGAYLTWLSPSYYGSLITSIAAFLVCAAGNIFNDIVDIEIDRINHPNRVLIHGSKEGVERGKERGGVSKETALKLSILFNIIGFLMALSVNWQVTLLALSTIGLLFTYNLYLKRKPLIGNIAVALMAGMTFITGGFAVDPDLALKLPGPLIPFLIAFTFHLVREIIKDLQDIDGDRKAGINTLPMIIGSSKSLLFTILLFVVVVILSVWPAYMGWFGRTYEVLAIYIVDLPLLVLLIFLWGNPSRRMLTICSMGMKAGMALGILAILLG